MKETTKQNLSILIISLLLAGSVFIFINYLKPNIELLKQTLISIEESKQKLKLLKDYQSKFQSLINTYSSSRDKVNLIDEAIPDTSQTAQIISIFNTIGQKTGIKPMFINFNESTDKNNYGILTINTEFIASYEGLKNWLQEIEKELRILDLNIINIKPVGVYAITTTKKNVKNTTGNQPLLDCNVTITAYYQI